MRRWLARWIGGLAWLAAAGGVHAHDPGISSAEATAWADRIEELERALDGVPEYMEYEINDTIEVGAGSIERDWIAQQRAWIDRIRGALAR